MAISSTLIIQWGNVNSLPSEVTLQISYSNSYSSFATGNNGNYAITYASIIQNLTSIFIESIHLQGQLTNPGKTSYLTIGY